jgi:hypothetical protein
MAIRFFATAPYNYLAVEKHGLLPLGRSPAAALLA